MKFPLLLSFTVLAAALPAVAQFNHSQLFFDASGTDQGAFAENQIITVSGNVTYFGRSNPRPAGDGVTLDFAQPATDIYIVPHGLYHGTGGVHLQLPLQDVAGVPNTVLGTGGGGFFEEPIAATYPQGSLVSGDYDVVLDEHQNRKFDLEYDLYLGVGTPALTIAIPLNAPSLPGTGIAAMKLRAISQFQATQALSAGFKVIQDMYDGPKSHLADLLVETGTGGSNALNFKQLMIRELVLVGWHLYADYVDNGTNGNFMKQPLQAAQNALENAGKHATGIAADPPDPDYGVNVILPPRQPDAADNENALRSAAARLAAVTDDEQRVSGALLAALEKYQGADAVGNGRWALAHARGVKHYAALLAAQWLAQADAIAQMRTALTDFPLNLEVMGTAYTMLQEDLRSDGFSPADRQALADSGLSGERLAAAQEKFLAANFSFSKSTLLAALDAKLAANTAGAPGLTQLSNEMTAVITALEAEPSLDRDDPAVTIGGPFNGTAGAPVNFTATATVTGGRELEFAWDLDNDGAFDDATGATPQVTFTRPAGGFAAVRVTSAGGREAVRYALLNITSTNRHPALSNPLPIDDRVAVPRGETAIFSIAVSDPDNDTVSVRWQLDGAAIGTGLSIAWQAPTQRGTHLLTAEATDGKGGQVSRAWMISVTNPTPLADLSVTMEAPETPVQTGAEFSWTMTVANHGPSAAANVVLTQFLPAGLTFVRSSTSFGTSSRSGGVVTANFGTVAAGGLVTMWVQTTAADAGSFQSSATASSDATDLETGNSSDSSRVRVNAPTPVPQSANVSLSAAVAPAPATVGGTQTITFTTTNAGPDGATGLILETQLPQSVEFLSSTPAALSSDDGLVRIAQPDVASGANTVATVEVRPALAGSGPAAAQVFAAQPDPALSNNQTEVLLSAVFVTPPTSDLVVTQTPPAAPRAGLPATWTITVTNNGPDAAEQVSLNDVLPARAIFSGSTPAPASLGNGRAGFTLGTLASGASRSVSLTVEPQAAGEAVNRVTASCASRDANGASDSSVVTVQPAPTSTANLAAVLSVSAPSAPLNTNVTLMLTISNAGPDEATDIIARTDLPSGLTFVSASGGATYANGIVTASVTSLASGASTSFTITATTAAAAPYVLLSTVSSSNLDPVEANNRAAASLLVNDPNAGIAIVRNFAAPEIEVLRTWLSEMGFTSQVFDQEGLTSDVLKNFKLVIWDDLGSAVGGIVAADVDLYQALTDSRVPLYFIGDDLARTTTLLSEPHATRWSQLIRLKDFVPGTAIPTFQIFTPGHPLVVGPYGNVSAPFTLGGDTDRDEHIDFADVVGINLLAHCAPLTKARRVTQNWLPTPAPTPQDQAVIVFKNSVAWLLASHTPADLAVTQSARSQVNLGGTIRIAATVTNRGPGAAGDVTLTNALPAGLGYSNVVADRGTAAFVDGKLTVRLGSLVAGESVSFEIMLTAQAAGSYQYELMADACVPDNNAADNRSTLPILVVPAPPVTLKATYRFDDTLAACEPDAPPLGAIDPANADAFGTVDVKGRTRRVYRWDGSPNPASAQAGLKLNTAGLLPRDNYTVEMLFRFTQTNSHYRSIIHTSNRIGDHSLYVSPSDAIMVYPLSNGPKPFVTGTFHHVTLTVAPGGTVTTWLDGELQRTETTSILNISEADLLHFFVDNDQGPAQTEYVDGEIALLRVYEGILPANRIAAQAAYPFGPGETMDGLQQFSIASNPAGVWACGHSTTRGTPFLYSAVRAEASGGLLDVWSGTGSGPHIAKNRQQNTVNYATIQHPPDLLNFDPSFDGRNAVLRWTAPAGGVYRVQGRFQGIDTFPNGTDVALLKNGDTATTLFEEYVLGFGVGKAFDVTVTLAMGETVDLSVGKGGNSNLFDSTGVDAVVTPVLLTDDCADGTDLSVTHTPPGTIPLNEPATLEMTVSNNGLRPAPSVVLSSALPSGFTLVSATAEGGTAQQSAGTITASLGTLAPGESRRVSLLVTAASAGAFTHTTQVTGGSFDPLPGNNTSSLQFNAGVVIPLTLTARTTVDSVTAGGEAVFELVMANGSALPAPGVMLSVPVPPGATFVSASGSGTVQNGSVTFPAVTLAAAQVAGYSLRLRADAPGKLTVNALASSADPSVREADASAAVTVLAVFTPPALQVVISTDPAQPFAGCRVTTTYTVTNTSATPASDATLSGYIPATLVVLTTTASQGSASVAAGRLSATLGTVLHGTPVTVTVVALATAAEATALSASVSGAILPAGLKHLWDFNEPAGQVTSSTVLHDLVSQAHGAVRGIGAATTGQGVRLPGGNQDVAPYIDLPNGLISPLRQVTFEGWLTVDALGNNWGHVFSFGSNSPGGANGEIFGPGNTNGGGEDGLDYIALTTSFGTDDQTQRFAVRNGEPVGHGEFHIDAGSPTVAGRPIHFAVTADNSTPGMSTFRYWRDGVFKGELANLPYNLSDFNDVNNWLGRGNWIGFPHVASTWDEFRLYDRALTAAEIEASRLAGPGPYSAAIATGNAAYTSTAKAIIRRNIAIPPPGSPCAVPVALRIFQAPAQQSYRLEWTATPGRKYLIQSSPDLLRWINVPALYTATQTTETWTDPGPPATEIAPSQDPERFYRVLELAE